MLTKPTSGLVTRKRGRKRAPSSCPNEALEWSGAHVFEEVLNDNNNALRGRARNNSGGKKEKAFVVFGERGGSETEEEQPRGGGARFRQEIPAEKVGLPPNYTAPCQQLYTNAHVHAYTLRNTHTHTD